MSIADNLILKYFILATDTPLDKIKSIETVIQENPLEAKKLLANTIVSDLYDEETAVASGVYFSKTVQNKELPSDIKKIETEKDILVVDFIANNNLLESRSEAKRLIEQGGVVFNEQRADLFTKISENGILKIGKRNFIEVNIK